ncbi:MAG: hypothetical protein Kow0074_13320 [Candidatus Zixiibacteriota bacterium]
MPGNAILYRDDIDSPLGPMIAGASSQGLCFLEWHDRGGTEQILKRVEKRYRLPLEEGEHPVVNQLTVELARYFDGLGSSFTVPLHIAGTPFEVSVWQQLLRIPYGETRSYGDIARELGKPGASRAVGRANGANYLSIVIPCHRVCDSNGKLHGYGGGLWRKQRLLELEAGVVQTLAGV